MAHVVHRHRLNLSLAPIEVIQTLTKITRLAALALILANSTAALTGVRQIRLACGIQKTKHRAAARPLMHKLTVLSPRQIQHRSSILRKRASRASRATPDARWITANGLM